jgi:hypothetical protein
MRPEARVAVGVDSQPGYTWLALPAVEDGEPGWVGEWEQLSVAKDNDILERDPRPAVPDEPARPEAGPVVKRPFRIRLAGQVRDGTRVLYCFFDTEDQRWFRMAGGGVDPEAGIRLEVAPGSGQPLVTDLADGARYVLMPGEAGLERIGFEESFEVKDIE